MGKIIEFTQDETELIDGLDTGEHLSDLGNAKRLIAVADGRLRYLYDTGKWTFFDGKSWRMDKGSKLIAAYAEAVTEGIAKEGNDPTVDKTTRKALGDWSRRAESAAKVNGMLWWAQRKLVIEDASDLDKDGWLLNCQNGTLDLKTGELKPHDQDDMIDKIVPVEYDPFARCPNWLEFLNMIMDGDAEMVEFLKRAAGYTMTGHTDERCLFILHGDGRNGKSTFTETIADILDGYAQKTPAETLLLKRYGDGISSDIARLRGSRFVYASETAEGRRLNESRIKELTGDRDAVTARFLYQELFTFIPKFKLWLHTNNRPTVRGTDQAVWDRIRLIPFNVRIPDDQVKPRREIDDIFRAEWPGILAWMVEGCRDWLNIGLCTPEPVVNSTLEYRDESDQLKEFLKDCCIIDDGVEIGKGELYEAYKVFADENGERFPMSKKKFGTAIMKRGFDFHQNRQEKNKEYWLGIGLNQ